MSLSTDYFTIYINQKSGRPQKIMQQKKLQTVLMLPYGFSVSYL